MLEKRMLEKRMLEKRMLEKRIITIIFVLATIPLLMQSTMASPPKLPNNTCVDCHRNLLFSSDQKQFIDMRIRHIESGISCSIDCHEDKANQSIDSSYALWSISTHASFNVTCDKCHKGNPLAISKNESHIGLSNDSITRENTPEMCGKCHTSQLEEFKSSLHFKRLESGEDVPAPACITCHQAHTVKVLTASDVQDFCSNCHNNITGIDPTVPQRAEIALSSVSDLRVNFSKVSNEIIDARTSGKNVSDAELELDSADMIIKNIPSVWHRFNLTYFATDVQQGINYTKNAESLLNQNTIPSKKSPGFEGVMVVIGLILIYFMKKKF